jgi:hypothetical protein
VTPRTRRRGVISPTAARADPGLDRGGRVEPGSPRLRCHRATIEIQSTDSFESLRDRVRLLPARVGAGRICQRGSSAQRSGHFQRPSHHHLTEGEGERTRSRCLSGGASTREHKSPRGAPTPASAPLLSVDRGSVAGRHETAAYAGKGAVTNPATPGRVVPGCRRMRKSRGASAAAVWCLLLRGTRRELGCPSCQGSGSTVH